MNERINHDLWGQDIALDDTGNLKIAASGEIVLVNGVDSGLQDIKLRLFTRLGTLFYDTSFGSLIHDWILEENTATSRAGLLSEVIMRVEQDARVRMGSVSAKIQKWDEKGVSVVIYFTFIDETHALNLILNIDRTTKDMVILDAKPREDSLTPYI